MKPGEKRGASAGSKRDDLYLFIDPHGAVGHALLEPNTLFGVAHHPRSGHNQDGGAQIRSLGVEGSSIVRAYEGIMSNSDIVEPTDLCQCICS